MTTENKNIKEISTRRKEIKIMEKHIGLIDESLRMHGGRQGDLDGGAWHSNHQGDILGCHWSIRQDPNETDSDYHARYRAAYEYTFKYQCPKCTNTFCYMNSNYIDH